MKYIFKGSEVIALLEKEIKLKQGNILSLEQGQKPNEESINSLTNEINFNTYKISHINPNLEYEIDDKELVNFYGLSKNG